MSLSVPERIQLVEDKWDTVAEMPEEVVLTMSRRRKLTAADATIRIQTRDPVGDGSGTDQEQTMSRRLIVRRSERR
jgi:hypothetical protein